MRPFLQSTVVSGTKRLSQEITHLLDIDHDKTLNFGIFLLVEPTVREGIWIGRHFDCGRCVSTATIFCCSSASFEEIESRRRRDLYVSALRS